MSEPTGKPWLGIRVEIPRLAALALGSIPLASLLCIWWWVTRGEVVEERFISSVILPSPGEVWDSFDSLYNERHLMGSVFTSLRRVVLGFFYAALIALPLGIAMGSFSAIKAMFQPVSVIGSYLPIAALVPLTLSWFGIDEGQKIVFLAIASFVFLLPMVVKAVDDVDEVYLQTAYTLGVTRPQMVFKVLIPIALSEIYQSMRLVFGVGWTYIILAEVVAAEQGLGHIIIVAQRRGPKEHIYLVLLVIIVLAFVTDKLLVMGGRALFPHKHLKR